MQDHHSTSYPESCDECQRLTGWPFAAGTCERVGVIRVSLRCATCGHVWESDGPSEYVPLERVPASVSLIHDHRR